MCIKPFILQFSFSHVSFLFLLVFSFSIFLVSLLAITYNKQNILILLVCIELIFLSIGLNFAFFSLLHLKISQVFTLFILTVAATESSIGLGLLINFYRLKKTINFKSISSLKL